MKNKVLIKLIVPELDQKFDVFIPVNELIWKVKLLITKAIIDINGIAMPKDVELIFMNRDTCKVYNSNETIINTDIRNGTELLLISKGNNIALNLGGEEASI